jgi:hypothetical protein
MMMTLAYILLFCIMFDSSFVSVLFSQIIVSVEVTVSCYDMVRVLVLDTCVLLSMCGTVLFSNGCRTIQMLDTVGPK